MFSSRGLRTQASGNLLQESLEIQIMQAKLKEAEARASAAQADADAAHERLRRLREN
jgi:hypothetical protein